jgi:hypothetical protein
VSIHDERVLYPARDSCGAGPDLAEAADVGIEGGLLTAYAQSSHAADMNICVLTATQAQRPETKSATTTPWSLRERLSDNVIQAMGCAYRAGATAPDLAIAHDLSLAASSTSCASPVSAGRRPLDNLRRQCQPRCVLSRPCPAFTARSAT